MRKENESHFSDSFLPLKKIKETNEKSNKNLKIKEISDKISKEFQIETITSNDSENKNVVRVFFFGKINSNTNISLTLLVKKDCKSIDIESSNVKQILVDALFAGDQNKKEDIVPFEVQMKEIVKKWLRISGYI